MKSNAKRKTFIDVYKRQVHGAFIRADDHQVFLVNADIGIMGEQGLYKRICGHEVVKTNQRNGILHPGVMGVKGDDVFHSQGCQFLQGHGTVQGLSLIHI